MSCYHIGECLRCTDMYETLEKENADLRKRIAELEKLVCEFCWYREEQDLEEECERNIYECGPMMRYLERKKEGE